MTNAHNSIPQGGNGTPEKFRTMQMAFDYAMYMMVSSCYASAKCATGLQEGKLYLRYQSLTELKQLELEDMCLSFIEDNLKKRLSQDVWNEDVVVRLLGKEGTNETVLLFEGRNYTVRMSTAYRGKNTKVKCFLQKKAESTKQATPKGVAA